MTRLILDYYRRWSLVLAIGAVPLLIQGWWIMADARTPIEFTASMIPIMLVRYPCLIRPGAWFASSGPCR